VGQRGKSKNEQEQLRHRRRLRDTHQPSIAAARAPGRQDHLNGRHNQGQHQSEVSKLYDHRGIFRFNSGP